MGTLKVNGRIEGGDLWTIGSSSMASSSEIHNGLASNNTSFYLYKQGNGTCGLYHSEYGAFITASNSSNITFYGNALSATKAT